MTSEKERARRYTAALSAAISAGHYGIIDAILKESPSHGTMTLLFASSRGLTALAQIAIKHGANIHAKSTRLGDELGKTALVLASEKNHYDIIRVLLDSASAATKSRKRPLSLEDIGTENKRPKHQAY